MKWNPERREIEILLTGKWVRTHEWRLVGGVWHERNGTEPCRWTFYPGNEVLYQWPFETLFCSTTYHIDYINEVLIFKYSFPTYRGRSINELEIFPERIFKILSITDCTLEIAFVSSITSAVIERERYLKIAYFS